MDPLSSIDPTVGGLDTSPPGQIAPMQNRQHRSLGALLAAAGLGALVVVLLATPDSQLFVLVAWVFVLAGVSAIALGIAMGFRHQARLDQESIPPAYLTADWVGGAQ